MYKALLPIAALWLSGCSTLCEDAAEAAQACGAADVAAEFDGESCDLNADEECQAECVIDAECADFDPAENGQTNVSNLEVCRVSCS